MMRSDCWLKTVFSFVGPDLTSTSSRRSEAFEVVGGSDFSAQQKLRPPGFGRADRGAYKLCVLVTRDCKLSL